MVEMTKENKPLKLAESFNVPLVPLGQSRSKVVWKRVVAYELVVAERESVRNVLKAIAVASDLFGQCKTGQEFRKAVIAQNVANKVVKAALSQLKEKEASRK